MTGIFTPAYSVSKRTGSDGQVAAPDCVAYEDTDEGLAAAKAAGIRCIDVRIVLATGLDPTDGAGRGTG
jgi:beta-phosphoglucomutase-like phosphatase (HAD superfamily)